MGREFVKRKYDSAKEEDRRDVPESKPVKKCMKDDILKLMDDGQVSDEVLLMSKASFYLANKIEHLARIHEEILEEIRKSRE